MKKMTLKQHLEMFLLAYKNPKTKRNYQISMNIIANLNTINVSEIIEFTKAILNKMNVRAATKNNRMRNIKTFLWRLATATYQNESIYKLRAWKAYEIEQPKRQPYNAEEQKIIAKALIEFNNPKFNLIFRLIGHNGLRLGEFTKLNFGKLKYTNYETQFIASKRGQIGYFRIPEYLIEDFEKYGVDYCYNTLQNVFGDFRKFVYKYYPSFDKPIHAHMLRHHDATRGVQNGLTPEEIRINYGLSNERVIRETYFHSNIELQRQIWIRKNMPTIYGLDQKQKDDLINIQRLIIMKLKETLKNNNITCDDIEIEKKLFTI